MVGLSARPPLSDELAALIQRRQDHPIAAIAVRRRPVLGGLLAGLEVLRTGGRFVDWFDGPSLQGNFVGTTIATTSGPQVAEADPIDNEIAAMPNATVSLNSNHFAGGTVTLSGAPTSNISTCSTNGVSSIDGKFTMQFNGGIN